MALEKKRKQTRNRKGETLTIKRHFNSWVTSTLWQCAVSSRSYSLGACFSDRTEPYIPHEGVQLLFSVFWECPLQSRVHRFTFPGETHFAISPIKYMQILSSSTRQKCHLCNPAIFDLLFGVFPNCSIYLIPLEFRNGIAIYQTNT